MSNQSIVGSDSSVGKQLVEALTQQEIAKLFDQVFAVLPVDLQNMALDQLPADTRRTVKFVLSPPEVSDEAKVSPSETMSTAKLEEIWGNLWREWYSIVSEAAQEEDGAYLAQEAHWEPPYFDETAFIEDLEEVAAKMRPLLQAAFQYDLSPELRVDTVGQPFALHTGDEIASGHLGHFIAGRFAGTGDVGG